MSARANWCKHYNGTVNDRCEAGVAYESVRVRHEPMVGPRGYERSASLPCIGEDNLCGATCPKAAFRTPEEIAAEDAEMERRRDLLRRGLSHCCEAPIDRSQVIAAGRYKGHGRRYCSKCRKLLFMV